MRNAILLVAVALVFAVGGVTYGAIRAADQTINACVEPANGQMFLMTATVCPAGQQPLSWNKEGPQGPPRASRESRASRDRHRRLPRA